MGTFRFEITELLCCEFRYRHRHFQVLEGHKPPSWQFWVISIAPSPAVDVLPGPIQVLRA